MGHPWMVWPLARQLPSLLVVDQSSQVNPLECGFHTVGSSQTLAVVHVAARGGRTTSHCSASRCPHGLPWHSTTNLPARTAWWPGHLPAFAIKEGGLHGGFFLGSVHSCIWFLASNSSSALFSCMSLPLARSLRFCSAAALDLEPSPHEPAGLKSLFQGLLGAHCLGGFPGPGWTLGRFYCLGFLIWKTAWGHLLPCHRICRFCLKVSGHGRRSKKRKGGRGKTHLHTSPADSFFHQRRNGNHTPLFSALSFFL